MADSQGLQFFSGTALLPDALLDTADSHVSIISHLQGTSPSWLVNSIIENALQGTTNVVHPDAAAAIANRKRVVLASFLNPADHFVGALKKNGLDLQRQPNYKFVDCFSGLFASLITNPENATKDCQAIFDSISTAIDSHDTVVIIEGLDVLLSATSLSTNELLGYLFDITKQSCQTFVVFPHDVPKMINFDATNPHDPSRRAADFLLKLHHRSSMNILVQPLPTGRASDLSGSLTVSKGPIPYACTQIVEREYTFHVSKDSSVKLYYR